MKFTRKPWVFGVAAIGLLVFSNATPLRPSGPLEEKTSRGSEILKQIEADYWNHLLDESIYLRMKHGLRIEKLPDPSFDFAASEAAFAGTIQERLRDVKPEELGHDETIYLEALKWDVKKMAEGLRFYWLSFPVTPYASEIPIVNLALSYFQFRAKPDLEHYLGLLNKYPSFVAAIQKKMEGQYARRIILPKDEIDPVLGFLSSLIKKPDQSDLYVKDARLGKFETRENKIFQKELVEIINGKINPAFEKLLDFIKRDYLQNAPGAVGVWQYPEGREYYRYLIEANTGLELSPEEINKIGLEQIEKDKRELERIKDSVGFKGTLAEFRQFLKTDTRFFPKTPQEIEDRLNSFVDGMSRKLDDYFFKKPKAPYAVKRLPLELEGGMTFGQYLAPTAAEPRGIYYYNGSQPNERSLLMAEGLIYHELIPGHHFQISLQQENRDLPDFKRESTENAYTEGWAEYSSWLGREMGLFQDPYSLCGKFMMDIFISTRLVVDSGMNYFEWPRSRAIGFMKENLIESETQINSESLRYSVDIPGQALGYKLGSLKMFELRAKAQKALGDRFDLRRFHDAVLANGALPLPILEKQIDWFIDQELSAKKQ